MLKLNAICWSEYVSNFVGRVETNNVIAWADLIDKEESRRRLTMLRLLLLSFDKNVIILKLNYVCLHNQHFFVTSATDSVIRTMTSLANERSKISYCASLLDGCWLRKLLSHVP